MQRTHLKLLAAGVCAFAIVGMVVIKLFPGSSSEASVNTGVVEQITDSTEIAASESNSPFAVIDTTGPAPLIDTGVAEPAASSIVIDTSISVDVTLIGQSPISDAEFEQLIAQLRDNPELLQQLVDEFRQETDVNRQLQLLRLLGEVGGPSVTLAASELIYSGDPESRRIGLELLQRVQPGNAEARDIASSLLATSVEPDVLVSTLTTLARPGDVSDENREYLAQQVAILATHNDDSVRSISLSVLSRWSTGEQFTAVFLDGLNDTADVVRESAAYSLIGHDDASPAVISALMAVATDSTENEQVRRGSILALRGMGISIQQQATLDRTERELNTRKR